MGGADVRTPHSARRVYSVTKRVVTRHAASGVWSNACLWSDPWPELGRLVGNMSKGQFKVRLQYVHPVQVIDIDCWAHG